MNRFLKAVNYTPWLVGGQEFPENGTRQEQLFFLIRYAVLAPSSHNAQPWRFFVYPDRIELGVERSRAVPIADPDDKLLRLALGAATQNIMIAAESFGLTCTREFPQERSDRTMIVLNFLPERKVVSGVSRKCQAISGRHVDRGPLYAEPLSEKVRAALQAVVPADGMLAITEGAVKRKAGECYLDARDVVMAPASLRREMARFKRTNVTTSELGMPGFTMGFSTLASFVVPTVLRHINVAKLARKPEEKLLRESTPAILVLGTQDATWQGDCRAGQFLQQIMLTAVAEGYATSIMASATVHPLYREKLRTIVGWDTTTHPFIMLRCGRSIAPPLPSPRLAALKVATMVSV
jgi:hypothetical protein